MRGLRHQVEADDEAGSEAEEAGSEQRKQRRQQSNEHVSTEEEATKEELLEQARELNVHGRSSMGKEELAQAVEAEESLTKDDLLERAREAGVEGRSSMRKRGTPGRAARGRCLAARPLKRRLAVLGQPLPRDQKSSSQVLWIVPHGLPVDDRPRPVLLRT
jgi:hypothetical protein